MTLRHLLPRTMNKDLSAKTTKYILKCWERSVKRKLNLNFIRVIKIYLLINVFYMYMVRQNLSKNSLMTISCSPLRTSLVTSATLLLRHKIFWLCQFSTEYTIRNCRQITFVTINRFFLLRWMEYQPKTNEKCTPFLHCISSFEGTSYKNL